MTLSRKRSKSIRGSSPASGCQLGARGQHAGADALRVVASEEAVEGALVGLDLFGGPVVGVGRLDDAERGDAVGEAGEVEVLLAQCLVDAQEDALDAREAVGAVGAAGLADVVELVAGVVAGGHAVEELLIGGRGRARRATGDVEQGLDGLAGDQLQRVEGAAASLARVDGDGVDLQQVADEGDEPGAEVLRAVGAFEEGGDAARGLAPAVAGAVLALGEHLGARDEAQLQATEEIEVDALAEGNAVVEGGEGAQLLEAGLLGGARALGDVVAGGIGELAWVAVRAAEAGRGRERLAGGEDDGGFLTP